MQQQAYNPYPSGAALDFEATAARYQRALDQMVAKLSADEQVLAAVLQGSLAYDRVWCKSDIDMMAIVRDQKLIHGHLNLTECDAIFSMQVIQRSDFTKMMEGALTGSIQHSVMRRGKLVFVRDENLRRYFEDIERVGERDRDLMYLGTAGWALGTLDKAEKYLYLRHDPVYAFHWFEESLTQLAGLEVLSHSDVPMREVLQQALRYNPDFFRPLYETLCHEPKREDNMARALAAGRMYLREGSPRFFRAILDYLKEEGDARSDSEIEHHFTKRGAHLHFPVLEWLSEIGLIQKLSLPIKLTPRSRWEVDEAAYLSNDL